jgi:hypothetical protein
MEESDRYLVHHFENELYKEFMGYVNYLFYWFMKWVE